MPTPAFFQNYVQVVAAIRLCVDKELISPALILIYATMDSYAWVVSAKQPDVRGRFESFAKNWLLTGNQLPCTPTDLYAARCAVLHTLTSHSDLSKSGKAKRIAYAWGNASTQKLGQALEKAGAQDMITLRVEDLANALSDAMVKVQEQADTDPELAHRLLDAAGQHYQDLEKRTVEQFLENVHNKAN